MLDTRSAPLAEGVHALEKPVDERAWLDLQVSTATRLVDLASDLVFFNHGMLLTYGGWPADPVADLVAKGAYPSPVLLEFTTQLFRGIDRPATDTQWDRTLLGVPRPTAEALLREVLSTAAIDRDRRRFHRAVCTQVLLPDPLVLQRASVVPVDVPTLPVTVFGLYGTHHFRIFPGVPSPTPLDLPLAVAVQPPDSTLVDQAKAFFATGDYALLTPRHDQRSFSGT